MIKTSWLICDTISNIQCSKGSFWYQIRRFIQGSFCICTQPMRDNATMQCRLSLAGCIHKMVPIYHQILQGSLEAATSVCRVVRLFRNLTDLFAALPLSYLSNFKAIWGFARFGLPLTQVFVQLLRLLLIQVDNIWRTGKIFQCYIWIWWL